ncbi:MAG: energy transducer TonB [Bacteroidia bacterium]|nr:energy transducer TonB [Bacteroidia bacterium]
MKTIFVIFLSIFWLTTFSQNDSRMRVQLLENYSNKIINNLDSVRLTSNKKQYLFLNIKTNKDSLFEFDKIISGTYNLFLYSANYDTVLTNIKTINDRNYKYIFYLFNRNFTSIQVYFSQSLFDNIIKNLKYPENAKKNGIQGKVFASFLITTTGLIDSIVIVRGVSPVLDNEVIKTLKSIKNISPIIINGVPTNNRFLMPFSFKL